MRETRSRSHPLCPGEGRESLDYGVDEKWAGLIEGDKALSLGYHLSGWHEQHQVVWIDQVDKQCRKQGASFRQGNRRPDGALAMAELDMEVDGKQRCYSAGTPEEAIYRGTVWFVNMRFIFHPIRRQR